MTAVARIASYADEPGLLARVRALLGPIFPGLPEAMDLAAPLGVPWQRCSTPFVRERDGRLLAHVGVIEMRFVLAGEERSVGILHAVGTDAAERRRGHYRAILDVLLPWCAERWETLVLNTGRPELYEPFGFWHVPEHRFVVECSETAARPRTAERFRRIDYADPADRARLRSLLDERAPVSRRLGVVAESAAFAFNECLRPPLLSDELDAIVCLEREGATLRVHDVVARRMPSLDDLLARVDGPVRRVELYFAPDEIEPDARPEPHVLHGDEHLMVRGPFAPEGEPLMLARPARC